MCCISSWYRFISPVNMLVLIWKPFGNGRWWLLWPESGWIKYAWFGLTFHRVQELCKSRGDLDGLVRVWSNASESGSKPMYRNHWAWFLAGRKWPSTSFPVRQSCILSQTSWIILYKTSCVRFGPSGSGPKARRCARIIRPASGQHFRADLDWMWNASGTFRFTGLMLCSAWTVENLAGCAVTVWVWHLSGRWQALWHGCHVVSK